jgi:glutamine synthetase
MMNTKVCLEYVWIDSENCARSKIKIVNYNEIFLNDNTTIAKLASKASPNFFWDQISQTIITHLNDNLKIESIPIWNFDGSSTGQAIGHESDVILRPIRIYHNPFFQETNKLKSYLILCECYNKDFTIHKSNTRANCLKSHETYLHHGCLFGIEQEYILFERIPNPVPEPSYVMFEQNVTKQHTDDTDDSLSENLCVPYKWIKHGEPGIGAQGPYYCSVGGDRSFGRNIVNEHMLLCLEAGIDICGTNAEVMASQWEFQIGTCDPLKVCDDLVMARYILQKITEKYNCWASFHPKPYKGDWNGSGAHTNFSTKEMREPGGFKFVLEACEKMREKHGEHIEVYGKFNDLRLTGIHETASINEYNWGVGNRGCSVRIPLQVFNNDCGYLEDRRPAANCDPYLVVERIMRTICGDAE